MRCEASFQEPGSHTKRNRPRVLPEKHRPLAWDLECGVVVTLAAQFWCRAGRAKACQSGCVVSRIRNHSIGSRSSPAKGNRDTERSLEEGWGGVGWGGVGE